MIILKKITIIVIVVIAIIIVAAVGVWGYQQVKQREALQNIQMSVDGVKVESINLTSATLNFSLRVTNPNTNAATIDRTDYTVIINNVTLGSGQNLEQVTIPAGGSVVIPQPFTVSYTGAAKTVWTTLTQGGADWNLVGTAFFDTPLGTVSVPYNFTGTTKG